MTTSKWRKAHGSAPEGEEYPEHRMSLCVAVLARIDMILGSYHLGKGNGEEKGGWGEG